MNNFTLFFMYDMVWVSLLAIIYATYALLSKPKGDKAVRLTIGFAFAYYLVFFGSVLKPSCKSFPLMHIIS